MTLLSALAHYGGPAALAADPAAAGRLAKWGRYSARDAAVLNVIASAQRTAGVGQRRQETLRVQRYAALALAAYREKQAAEQNLKRLAEGQAVLLRMGSAVGACTSARNAFLSFDPVVGGVSRSNLPCSQFDGRSLRAVHSR